MAEAAVLRQDKDGRLAVMEPGEAVTDPASNGEPLLRAAQLTGNKKFREAADRNLAYLLNKAPKKQGRNYLSLAGQENSDGRFILYGSSVPCRMRQIRRSRKADNGIQEAALE